VGYSGIDLMFVGAGADTLYGGYADDELHGGDGRDALFGEQGRDRFFDNYFSTREDYDFWRESWNGIGLLEWIVIGTINSSYAKPTVPAPPTSTNSKSFFQMTSDEQLESILTMAQGNAPSIKGGWFSFPEPGSGGVVPDVLYHFPPLSLLRP
jgi:hypothetical protein